MHAQLQYGQHGLPIEIPSDNVRVIEPCFLPGLPDEAAEFQAAVRRPIASAPLTDLIKLVRPGGPGRARYDAAISSESRAAVVVRRARARAARELHHPSRQRIAPARNRPGDQRLARRGHRRDIIASSITAPAIPRRWNWPATILTDSRSTSIGTTCRPTSASRWASSSPT